MITTIAQALFDRLIAAFPPDRTYGRLDIRREPMPRALADYLEQVLHMKLREALRESHFREAWVDSQAAEFAEARAHFANVAARRQGFPPSEWPDFLKNACCQTLYLVIQPTASLIDSLFDPLGTPVHADTMRDRMGFYPARIPYRDELDAWLQEQGDEPVERERFEAFAREADRRLAAESSPRDWLRLLDPLAQALAAAGYREIPVEFLEAFWREKSAETLLQYLARRYDSEESIPVDALEAFLASAAAPGDESVEETTEKTHDETTEEQAEPAERHAAPQPLWKRFAQDSDRVASAEEPPEPAASAQNGTRPAEPLWKQFRHDSSPAPAEEPPEQSPAAERIPAENGASVEQDPPVRISAPEPDPHDAPEEIPVASVAAPSGGDAPANLTGLEHVVLGERGARNRGLFVQCLFQGQEAAYEAVLQRLREAKNWSEASQTIASEVFTKRQVNIYSPPAVTFTEAVEARYGGAS